MHNAAKNLYQFKKQACLLAGLVFLVPGCGERARKKSSRKRSSDELQFQEAKLSDIPVLLGAQRLENKNEVVLKKGQNVLLFNSTLPRHEIVEFYEQEMECMGWRELGLFNGKESILIFEKPYSIATILIRENQKKKATHITVLLSLKN